jgi:predicted MPP superfamily phosphohydrolase
MFRLTIFSLYFLVNIYLYFRLKRLMAGRHYKKQLIAFFILLAIATPFTSFLAHIDNAARIRSLLNFGYYGAAYLFYLFFIFIFYDMLLAANRFLAMIPSHVMRSRSFQNISLCILMTVPIVVVIIGRENYSHLRINEYRIAVPKKPAKIEHIKIAVASDFHLGELSNERFLRDFVDKLNAQKPDLVLLPGDIVEGGNRHAETGEFERQFERIESTYGVYASLGNHEYHGTPGNLDFFRRAKITVLQDAVMRVGDAFYLVGRNDNHINNRKSMQELLSYISVNLPIIVIDHRPSGYDGVSRSPVDIEVSGHTHNGQIFPFNYMISYLYDLSWGYKKIRNTHFFVTCGIQGWGPHVRTAGASEIMIINVDFVNNFKL